MDTDTRRWTLSAGFAFVALWLIGIALTTVNAIPGVDEPLSMLTGFYEDSGNRIPLLVGGVALGAAGLGLVIFAIAATANTPPGGVVEAPIARLAAGVFASCAAIGGVALALVAGELTFRTVPQPDPQIERWLAELGYAVILVPGMLAAATVLWALARCNTSSKQAVTRGLVYLAAVVSLFALPVSIATGTLLWSQLPLCAGIALIAGSARRAGQLTPTAVRAPARQ